MNFDTSQTKMKHFNNKFIVNLNPLKTAMAGGIDHVSLLYLLEDFFLLVDEQSAGGLLLLRVWYVMLMVIMIIFFSVTVLLI